MYKSFLLLLILISISIGSMNLPNGYSGWPRWQQKKYDTFLKQARENVESEYEDIDKPFDVKSRAFLLEATKNGDDYFEATKLLLDNGVNPNYLDDQTTPLHEATDHNAIKSVKLLLQKSADPNIKVLKQKKVITPLALICQAKNDRPSESEIDNRINIAVCLLQAGAKVEDTLLDELITEPYREWRNINLVLDCQKLFILQRKKLIELLIEYGANPFAKNKEGKTHTEVIESKTYNEKLKHQCIEFSEYAKKYAQYFLGLLHQLHSNTVDKKTYLN